MANLGKRAGNIAKLSHRKDQERSTVARAVRSPSEQHI
jgi:hypothetical protein